MIVYRQSLATGSIEYGRVNSYLNTKGAYPHHFTWVTHFENATILPDQNESFDIVRSLVKTNTDSTLIYEALTNDGSSIATSPLSS